MNFLLPAARLLRAYYRRPQTNLKLLHDRFLKRHPQRDPQPFSRAVYGVLRKDLTLEQLIRRFNRSPQPPDLETRTLLKIGLFLLLFSDAHPDYAVVDQTVRHSPLRSKAFVNGLLRSVVRQKEALREEICCSTDPLFRHALSSTLVERVRRLGSPADAIMEYLDREPVFHLRLRAGRILLNQVETILRKKNVTFRAFPALQTLEVSQAAPLVRLLPGQGSFYFQNSGSQLVSHVAAAFAVKRVLDAAAAPGTKALTLSLLRPELSILASDLRPARLRLMQKNLARFDISRVRIFAADMRHPPLRGNPADLILLDAPCTGAGTLRKNPDLKAKIDERAIAENSRRQFDLLTALLPLCQNSYLLYAVCSFIEEESEGVLRALASRRPLHVCDLSPLLDRYGFSYLTKEYGFYLLPSDLNNDLFYISLLKM